jgi:hypothetical protein
MLCAKIFQKIGYGLLWGIPGIAALFEGLRINKAYPAGSWSARPGTYLILVACPLIAFAIYELVVACKKRAADEPASAASPVNSQFIKSMILLVGYICLLPFLGFSLASMLFLLCILHVFGNSVRTILVTMVITFLCLQYMLPALGVALPRGLFGL